MGQPDTDTEPGQQAIALLAEIHKIPVEHFNTEPRSLRYSYARARYLAHPSRNHGNTALWDRVNEAGAVLGLVLPLKAAR